METDAAIFTAGDRQVLNSFRGMTKKCLPRASVGGHISCNVCCKHFLMHFPMEKGLISLTSK
jgi:hypothetical protein